MTERNGEGNGGRAALHEKILLRGERPKFQLTNGKSFKIYLGEAQSTGILKSIDFDWLYMSAKPNKRLPGDIEVVFINGPLEHKSGWFFDSYEDIIARIEGAMTGY